VSIAPVNDAPVAAAHENKGDEDQPIKGKCVGTDVDKDVLSYSLAGKPRFGVVEIDAASGAYTYTPNANYNGEDAFRFEVSDGKLRAQAEVKLTIAPVNDAPEVKNVALSTLEDKAIGGAVPASDIDKDKLTWTLGKAPTKGKAVVEDTTGKVQYTPNQDENGDDTFTVIVSDGKAKTEATVTVAIAPVNDAPVAAAQQNSGNEDTPIKGKLEGSDVDKDTLTYSVVVKPRAGAVELDAASGNYTYTPVANFNGEDGFRFEVSDGKLKSAADVKLTIHAVNDAPEPKDLVLSTLEDREVRGKVIATDVDKDVLTFRLKKAPAKGTAFVDDATGAVRYVPAPDQMEAAAFVVEVTDGFASTDASVKVEITPQPDAPRVDVRAIETAEDEPVTIKLTAYDADGDNVTFKVVAQPKLGNAEIDVDGVTLRFTPRADVHGEDEIAVEASDGKNKTRAQLPLRVAARNDPPTIDAVTIEMWEDTSADIAVVARDKDGDAVKITLPEKIANVEAVKLSGGMLSVTPKKDYAGPIEIMLTPSDAAGKGAPGRVAIDVKNVNDAPTVKDLVIKAEPGKAVSGVVEAQDVDVGDELTFSLAAPPKQGSVTIDDARSGRFTYTATANAHGENSFRIRVKDKAGESVAATVGVSIVTSRRPVAQR
jgi:VCBS repeat-containing protein